MNDYKSSPHAFHQSCRLRHETRGEAASAAGCRRGLYFLSQAGRRSAAWRIQRGSVLVAPRPRSLFKLTPVSDADASCLTDPTNESPSSAHQPVSDVGPDELKSERRLKKGCWRRAAVRSGAAHFTKQLQLEGDERYQRLWLAFLIIAISTALLSAVHFHIDTVLLKFAKFPSATRPWCGELKMVVVWKGDYCNTRARTRTHKIQTCKQRTHTQQTSSEQVSSLLPTTLTFNFNLILRRHAFTTPKVVKKGFEWMTDLPANSIKPISSPLGEWQKNSLRNCLRVN